YTGGVCFVKLPSSSKFMGCLVELLGQQRIRGEGGVCFVKLPSNTAKNKKGRLVKLPTAAVKGCLFKLRQQHKGCPFRGHGSHLKECLFRLVSCQAAKNKKGRLVKLPTAAVKGCLFKLRQQHKGCSSRGHGSHLKECLFRLAAEAAVIIKGVFVSSLQPLRDVYLAAETAATREVFVLSCRDTATTRRRLFGAAEAGSSLGGCLFGLGSAAIEDVGVLG
nr:hypothetical protein [Tanacetum cinerariifolium]